MDSVLDVEEPEPSNIGPDGNGHWPNCFVLNLTWAEDRGDVWRAVANYPTLMARRIVDRLELKIRNTTDIYSYQLTKQVDCYLAERI